jgi:glycosyltransferase involved in cell wall biosynthesis
MNDEHSISIIVPVYNERELLQPAIDTISGFMSENFRDYEILIIESGSTDGTFELCDEIARRQKNIRVLHEGARNGFGSGVKMGYRNAKKEIAWLVTVDLPFPLEAIFQALQLIDQFDFVLSYRSRDDRSAFRKIQSLIYNIIIKVCLGLRVKHVNSGFRIFRTKDIRDLPIQSNGWFLDAEVLYHLKKRGLTYTEIPIELIDRTEGKSSVGAFAFIAILKELYNFLKRKDI